MQPFDETKEFVRADELRGGDRIRHGGQAFHEVVKVSKPHRQVEVTVRLEDGKKYTFDCAPDTRLMKERDGQAGSAGE